MPVFKPLPPKEAVEAHLFICNDSPSGLRWRVARGRQLAGSVAGNRSRYWVVNYLGAKWTAQRLVWLLHYGEDPGDRLVDHINRNKHDNRIANLRLATRSENAMNNCGYSHNRTTGVRGVFVRKTSPLFYACIKLNQQTIDLGGFPTLKEAAEARRAAELELCGEFSALDP